MAPDIDKFSSIPDKKPVRIFLPIRNKAERYRTSCIFEKKNETEFELLFKRGTLPMADIDTGESCVIHVDMGGASISIKARIKSIITQQKLAMMVEKSMSHDQLREFFRVDATTQVISSHFQPVFSGQNGDSWSIPGTTIDISGNGILAGFHQMPPMEKQVQLKISLPTSDPEEITVLAHPVRSQQVSDTLYEVAYHFDDISTEDRDKIIGCCLIIQRRLLRLKVEVNGAESQ